MPSIQREIIEQAKILYSLIGRAFKKQTETIEDQGTEQLKAIEDNEK